MTLTATIERVSPGPDGLSPRRTRVVTYERVSSEDQRERETIRTQTEDLARKLGSDDTVELVDRYVDDGVSGKIPMHKRPGGARLLRDARAGLFEQVWVFKLDRLGRDDIDPLVVRQELTALGVKLWSLHDAAEGNLEFALRVAIAAEERRSFLVRSAAGMNRTARQGRYTGGIVPFGYMVSGHKQTAQLVPNDAPIHAEQSAADVVRELYRLLGVQRLSCRTIAQRFNQLGVPTAYQLAGRGVRGKLTQGLWRAGRIRNLVTNPVYRGELQYGRRATSRRDVITASVPALVSDELWQAAQQTLSDNRLIAKNGVHQYLLRGLIVCGLCGLHFCGSKSQEVTYYRCDGYLVERGPMTGRCAAKAVKGNNIEPQVWADVARFLRDPGALLDELAEEVSEPSRMAVAEAELTLIDAQLGDLDQQDKRISGLFIRGRMNEMDHDTEQDRIAGERTELLRKQAALLPLLAQEEQVSPDLLGELRERLDAGLTFEVQQEVVRLLVRRITVFTEVDEAGKKKARVSVEYRFPGVGLNHTGTGSSQPAAESSPETSPSRVLVRL